jgi:hypothetical protein
VDKKQAADKKKQDNNHPDQTCRLSIGGFMVRFVPQPMVMSIQATLPLECSACSA